MKVAAARALFTIGHLSLETAQVPPETTVKAVQAITLPSHLEQHAAALSPKLTPGSALPPQHTADIGTAQAVCHAGPEKRPGHSLFQSYAF